MPAVAWFTIGTAVVGYLTVALIAAVLMGKWLADWRGWRSRRRG